MRKKVLRNDGAEAPKPVNARVNLGLRTETAQRLGVVAAMRRITISALAEEALALHLRGWRLPSRIGGVADGEGGSPTAGEGGAQAEG